MWSLTRLGVAYPTSSTSVGEGRLASCVRLTMRYRFHVPRFPTRTLSLCFQRRALCVCPGRDAGLQACPNFVDHIAARQEREERLYRPVTTASSQTCPTLGGRDRRGCLPGSRSRRSIDSLFMLLPCGHVVDEVRARLQPRVTTGPHAEWLVDPSCLWLRTTIFVRAAGTAASISSSSPALAFSSISVGTPP